MTADQTEIFHFSAEIVGARGGGAGVIIPAELVVRLGGQR